MRMMQQSLSSSPTMKKRAKSVYQQRNLGTIKSRKKEKREEKEVSNGETIMQILRMRQVFLSIREVLSNANIFQAWHTRFHRTAAADYDADAG